MLRIGSELGHKFASLIPDISRQFQITLLLYFIVHSLRAFQANLQLIKLFICVKEKSTIKYLRKLLCKVLKCINYSSIICNIQYSINL